MSKWVGKLKEIAFNNVGVRFNGRDLLKNVSVKFRAGRVYRIVGPNGSGKSTMLKLLTGIQVADTGTISVDGKSITSGNFLRDAGVLINKPIFLEHLSGIKNLKMLASIKAQISADDCRQWMRRLGLNPEDRTAVAKYSTGMRQKLGIAQAVMESPQIVLLDEPLSGLDRASKQLVIALLVEIKRNIPNLLMVLISHEEDIATLVDVTYEIDSSKVEAVK